LSSPQYLLGPTDRPDARVLSRRLLSNPRRSNYVIDAAGLDVTEAASISLVAAEIRNISPRYPPFAGLLPLPLGRRTHWHLARLAIKGTATGGGRSYEAAQLGSRNRSQESPCSPGSKGG